MRLVSRLPVIAVAVVAVAVAIALIGEALSLDGVYYPIAFFVGMFVVSLTDRDRFYARDLRHGQR